MRPPTTDEYDEYYGAYVGRVPDRPVLDVLAEAPDALGAVLDRVPVSRETFAYAPDKWTVREVVGHILDTERVFGYRALHMARSDPAALPGMDQLVWAAGSNAASRPLADLLREFRALRESHVALFSSFDDTILGREGVASGARFTVRALVFVVAGHEIHHRGVLEDRYVTARS
ncbi:MAG: DinB family protein [Gemmatimonadota bacterium]|nr:DinB family protein [Gemmatimonadota bacterium]